MSRRSGFTLLEVVFAVTIAATALIALQATVSGSILSAGDSINRRAAREMARAKLEEILAGVSDADGGGTYEDRPNFEWKASSKPMELTWPEGTTPPEIKVVTLELTYPKLDSEQGQQGGGEGRRGKITLNAILPLEPPPQTP